MSPVSRIAPAIRKFSTTSARNHMDPNVIEAKGNYYKKLFYFVCIPALVLSGANAFHHEFYAEHDEPEVRPVEYMRRQKRNFPWRDGKQSFFHNPRVNKLLTWEQMENEDWMPHLPWLCK